MDTNGKLQLLASAAKYDVACTSSGVDRGPKKGKLGSCSSAGLCHSWSADGRCVTLLKVLLTNVCAHDCAYCINRCSNDIPRTAFTPRELADLAISFYRRNYIEGLFISSGVLRSPDYTMELIIETARILREEEGFLGYIHAKAIPGASPELVERLGFLVDRMSVNVELPSQSSLDLLAPQKASSSVVAPMRLISDCKQQNAQDIKLAKRNKLASRVPRFAPAGQSTQLIVGASPETDHHILMLAEGLYKSYGLKRVFFSAYIPVNDDWRLPALNSEIPLTREHRLYQADWLMRFYGFEAKELFEGASANLDLLLDPKASWALRHIDQFPVEVNRASLEELLRVPGLGVTVARRIVRARKMGRLSFEDLKRMGLSLKRSGFFITCNGRMAAGFDLDPVLARKSMESSTRASGAGRRALRNQTEGQLSLFEDSCQRAQDPWATPQHKDKLLDAALSQVLPAHVVTPSGLPLSDPLLEGEAA